MPQVELDALRERLVELHSQAEELINVADADKRDLSADDQKQVDEYNEEFERIRIAVESREKVEANRAVLEKSAGRKTEPMPVQNDPTAAEEGDETPQPRLRVPATAVTDRGRWGWRSIGDFAIRVRESCLPGHGALDKRLEVRATPTTFGAEGIGADGGHAVPPDFRAAIISKIRGESSLLPMTDEQISSSNTITVPKDEDAPWSSSGITAYWDGEGVAATQSKPLLGQTSIQLNKMRVLVPITDELMEDAPGLTAWLTRKAPEKMDFKLNLAIVQGTGVGQPLGILNSPCLVSVVKESQSADTIVFNNIIKMWSRMYGPSRANAVWLINQDIEPQLFTMSFEGTSSSVPAYLPANGLSASPFGTLMGRPVIPTQACETLGDKGDIIFADLSQYLTATKAGGIRSETSIHLWFDYDMTAFRFIFRVAGQPWWSKAVSPRDGTNTLSPFVTLNERT